MTHKWRMKREKLTSATVFFANTYRKAEKISQYICLFKNKQYLCTRKCEDWLRSLKIK